MRSLVWNCQGLGGPLTISQLEEACKLHSPDIVFISETKNKHRFIRKVCKRIKFQDLYVVDPIGTAGGLALFYQQGNSLELDLHFGDMDRRVSNQMNQMLMKPITEMEVRRAVFSMKTHSAPGPDGGGVAVFDHNYNLIEVWGRSFRYLGSALRTEAETARWALLVAKEKGFSKLHLKSDSKLLVHMINGSLAPIPEVLSIILDIQKLINDFNSCNILFIPRSKNIIGDSVAKYAKKLINPAFWTGFFPSWIVSLKHQEEMVRRLV